MYLKVSQTNQCSGNQTGHYTRPAGWSSERFGFHWSVKLFVHQSKKEKTYVGFDYNERTRGSPPGFGPFPGGITFGLQDYAQHSRECTNASMSWFLQQVPFILLGKVLFHTSFPTSIFDSSSNFCPPAGKIFPESA